MDEATAVNFTPKNRRRPGQACDSCHRKKTRCHWRHPACADCIRLNVPCTFERSKKSPLSGGIVDGSRGTSEDGPASEIGIDENAVDGRPTLETGQREANRAAFAFDGAGCDENDGNALDIPQALDVYFSEINHTFPILNRNSFSAWSNDNNPNDPAFNTCLQSILCSTLLHAQLSGSDTFSDSQRHLFWDCLREALSNTGNLLVATPSLHAVQALVSLVACVQRTKDGAEKSLPLVAVAVRFANRLGLHRLDEQQGLSVEERLESLRLWWCLYILDRSTSLRLHLPPVIQDADLNVLTPKMFSDDGVGLIRAINSPATVNLFTARHRLAVISSAIWTNLYTFSGMHQPTSSSLAVQEMLQRRLLDWKMEWFYTDYPNIEWPVRHLLEIVHLQFEFFYCLLNADQDAFPPDGPKSITMLEDNSPFIGNLKAKVNSGTAPWVDAARETLRLAAVVRKGGLNYLQ